MVVAAPRPAWQSTRFRSGALSFPAWSARSTTRSTFYLALPGLTLTTGFPELRCLSRTTLGFRPPPDYGSGGWGFESLAARNQNRWSSPLWPARLAPPGRPPATKLRPRWRPLPTRLRPPATTLAATPNPAATTCDHDALCRLHTASQWRLKCHPRFPRPPPPGGTGRPDRGTDSAVLTGGSPGRAHRAAETLTLIAEGATIGRSATACLTAPPHRDRAPSRRQ
jgi:hypothetical protein